MPKLAPPLQSTLGIEIYIASKSLPQQLANLLLATRRPDIQPSPREAKNVEPRGNSKSDSFERTLDRQLDRQQPAKRTEQTQPKERPQETREATAPKDDAGNDETFTTDDIAKTDTDNKVETSDQEATGEEAASNETTGEENTTVQVFATNPSLVNTPETTGFKAGALAPAANKASGQNVTPGNPTVDETAPDAAPKEVATGVARDQKPIALTQTSESFTKELAAFTTESGSKVIAEEAKAQLAKQSDEAKSDKNSGGLLQKALAEVSGLQNGAAKAAPNATAIANANPNAGLLTPTVTGDTPANISQSLEALSITPQNAHAVSTKFGTAIQSNQSAQTAINSLAVQIAKNVDLGINRFQIRMDPPELGRIDVKLEFGKDGRMTANLTVERPETLDLLQKDARALERALTGSGLNTDKDSLNFSLKDQSANEFANFRQDDETGSGHSRHRDEEADLNSPINQTIAAYRGLISSAAVDIRI